jgi:general secretion pathway protein H
MKSRSPNGYTLLELLVVMGILAVLAAVAVPVASRAIESAMLNADARATVVELRHLENEAVARQTSISVSNDKDGALAISTGERWTVPSGSTVRVQGEAVAFFPDGTSGGGVLEVRRAGGTIGIAVAWLSGDVEETP